MQITTTEVITRELQLPAPIKLALAEPIHSVTAIFVRVETRQGQDAWGCAVADPIMTGEDPAQAVQIIRDCSALIPDLHPTHIEYSLAELAPHTAGSPAATCAFDLVFHDLLGLSAGLPLYRLLGGYRQQIQTSVTIPLGPVQEAVERASAYAGMGFRMLKIKGGCDPSEDVRRVRAIRRALPDHQLRLDADGGYDVQQALDVARILEGRIQVLEQPTAADDLESLERVTRLSPIPVLADQSISGPDSALALAAGRFADGMSIKLATCGGLHAARQVDSIARAAHLTTMVSCVVEPALLIAAGLSFALSSSNVAYADLDGHLELLNDPSLPGFQLEDGCLTPSNAPGLGCQVLLD